MCGATARRLYVAASGFITDCWTRWITGSTRPRHSIRRSPSSRLRFQASAFRRARRRRQDQGFAQQRAAGYCHANGAGVEPAHRAGDCAAHFADGGLYRIAQLPPDPVGRHERARAAVHSRVARRTITSRAADANPAWRIPLRGCRRAWASTTRWKWTCGGASPTACSSAETTPTQRIWTMGRRGTRA